MAVDRKATKKPFRAARPAVKPRFFRRGRPIRVECAAHGLAEVLIERADRLSSAVNAAAVTAQDIDRSRDRESRDRKPAGERFDIYQTERVGPARKDEHVRRAISGRKFKPLLRPQKQHIRIGSLELVERRSAADHDFRAGDVELEKCADVLLGSDPADIEQDRPRQILQRRMRLDLRACNSAASVEVAVKIRSAAPWKRRTTFQIHSAGMPVRIDT